MSWSYGKFPLVGTSAPFNITAYKEIRYVDGPWDPSMADLYVGLSIAKTGRTTGKTTGTISHTCVGVRQFRNGIATGRFLFCQFQASSLNNLGGDSGSPVYRLDSQNHMNPLLGVLWGTAFENDDPNKPVRSTFSHIYYVTAELRNAMGGGWLDMGINDCVLGPNQPTCPTY